MQPVNSSATQYDKRTIVFHWLTAILVVVQWLGSKTFDLFPKGPLQIERSRPTSLWASSSAFWCFPGSGGARRTVRDCPMSGAESCRFSPRRCIGTLSLILAVVGLGLTMISLRSFSFFNLFNLPTIGTATRPFLRSVHGIHELLANVILIAAGLHAIIAIVHQYAWHNGVLARMVPRLAAR